MIPRIDSPCSMKDILRYLKLPKNEKKRLIRNFEKEFSRYLGVKHAIAVSSARIALFLLVKHLKIKRKSKVIVPSYTASIVPYVLDFCRINPIYIDASRDNFLMNMKKISASMLKSAKATIATPINGLQMDMKKLLQLCKKHKLALIEDNAQACGASFKGKKLGSFGKAGYFSFGFSKQICTLCGGMVTTNDDLLAKKIRNNVKTFSEQKDFKKVVEGLVMSSALNRSPFKWTISPIIGFFRLFKKNIITEMFGDHKELEKKDIEKLKIKYSYYQAFLGLKQLKGLDRENKKRNQYVKVINKVLGKHAPKNMLKGNKDVTYVNYEIAVKDRQRIIKELYKKGVDSQITWMKNCSRNKDLHPVSSSLEKQTLVVPIYPSLTKEEIIYIGKEVKPCLME